MPNIRTTFKNYVKPALLNVLITVVGILVFITVAGLLGNESAGWGVLAIPLYSFWVFVASIVISYLVRNRSDYMNRKLIKFLPSFVVFLWVFTQLAGIT